MRVHPDDVDHWSPLVFAILIDAGYVTDWPHLWTRSGARAVRRNRLDDGSYNGNRVLAEAYASLPPGAGPVRRHENATGAVLDRGGVGRADEDV